MPRTYTKRLTARMQFILAPEERAALEDLAAQAAAENGGEPVSLNSIIRRLIREESRRKTEENAR